MPVPAVFRTGLRVIPPHLNAARPSLRPRVSLGPQTSVRCLAVATPNPLPASYLRGGTSKGIFIQRHHLPKKTSDWGPILLGLMGSPDPEHGRQLDGMGGGVSSLSKVCVVAPSDAAQRAQGIDVVYTFVQVGVRDGVLDFAGNCGNLSSMIGVFAIDEGICTAPLTSTIIDPVSPPPPSRTADLDAPTPQKGRGGRVHTPDPATRIATVRSLNTNTNKIIDTTFPVSAGPDGKLTAVLDLPQAAIAGVPGKASEILLQFLEPAGARTGKLLPSGKPIEFLKIPKLGGMSGPEMARVSLVDATNPTVFVSHNSVRDALCVPDDVQVDYAHDTAAHAFMEAVRREGAVRMGLDPTVQAQPKVAVLSAPAPRDAPASVDISCYAFSMGTPHKAIPMTVGLCLGVASGVKGTLPWELVQAARRSRGADKQERSDLIKMRHPSGLVEVGASFDDAHEKVLCANVVRTGRRLMKGDVWW